MSTNIADSLPDNNTVTEVTDINIKRHTTSNYEESIIRSLNCIPQLNILSLRKLFLLLTRSFFSDPTNFSISISPDWVSNKDIQYYTYSDPIIDPEGNVPATLDIVSSYIYSDNMAKIEILKEGQKPTIFINVGDINFRPYEVLNTVSGFLDKGAGHIEGYLCDCSVIFNIAALSYADCALLAQLLSSFLGGIRSALLKNTSILKEYTLQKISAPVCNNPDQANKIFTSTVAIQLIFENNYIIKPDLLRIKTIDIKLNAD